MSLIVWNEGSLCNSAEFNPPTPWGHEACRWSLKPKPLPPLVSSHYPKLILRGEVYLSPPPLHWVVAPAFNICSDYSRSRNLMLSPRAPIEISTFFMFWFRQFLRGIFIPRRFSWEVSSVLKIAKWAIFKSIYKTKWNINIFSSVAMQIHVWTPKTAGRSSLLKWLIRIWSYAHRCLVNLAYRCFCVNFNGIDEIALGFNSKVEYRKSSNIMFKLSMLQKVPKRRSPNLFNYKLKWA